MEKLDFALEVMVVGFFVVMATLIMLYVILIFFNRIFNKNAKKDIQNVTSARNLSRAEAVPDNSTLTAVITAAVYSYLESNTPSFNPATSIKVTARPAGGCDTNSWQLSGRRQLMEVKAELDTTRRNKKREKI